MAVRVIRGRQPAATMAGMARPPRDPLRWTESRDRAPDAPARTATVRDRRAMIAAMEPTPVPGDVVFCSTRDEGLAAAAMPCARGIFAEEEGLSLILPLADAAALGFDTGQTMRQITLAVHSALDGVGLTEAVAATLAGEGIPCNIVAAYHHDHVFVPSEMAERALAALRVAQRSAGAA